ncbi:unnamed protein product [Nippostrongylus brasiliensis]|uniref:t-SNARE coiled-coil homology domain-containing protein n=1 Tax=Nippostrongylus brasiliensis TaxID=27835 RepID=A0A0N4YMC5_NIPBR|nr:unnamed protein product [Nippostrongylus brasiliensis]
MVCLILVLSTAISIRTAITAIPGQVNSSAIYVENFTVQLDTYITCTYNKQLDDMSDVVEKSAKKIKKEVHTLHGAIDKYEKSPKNYKAVFNATQLRNGLAMLEKEIDTFGGQRRAIHKTFENVLSNSLSSEELKIPHQLENEFSDIFYKCKNGYTFFDAMDGASIMAESEMKDKIHFLSIRDAQAEIEKGVDDDDTIVDYKTIQTDTEEGKLCHLIGRIVSKDLRDDVSAINEKVKSTAENLVNSLVDMSPSCENIMVLWNDIGYFVCKVGAQPLSGIWLASRMLPSVLIYAYLINRYHVC